MTPLAHRILKRLTMPVKKREPFGDPDGMLALMGGIHCFEVTAVHELLEDLGERFERERREGKDLDPRLAFLPAPRTWIEWLNGWKGREPFRAGWFLVADDNVLASSCAVYHVFGRPRNSPGYNEPALTGNLIGHLPLHSSSPTLALTARFMMHGEQQAMAYPEWMQLSIYAALAIINSPRVIGRRQHMPHAGLERELTSKLGRGKFPLHAWTEIKLSVRPPEVAEGDHEAHLTGRRALHFCRAHLRVRLGKLEHVSAHWRGDPALGIKRSRYTLTP